ncbi:MAG: ABC transporter substrate-binding protein [Cocleimonas sp.]
MKLFKRIGLAAALAVTLSFSTHAEEVEVLHYWTSGGEAKSLIALKEMLEKKGVTWKDFAVAGGGGDSAMTVLKSRVVAGNPPAAAQIKGPSIQEWADEGTLADIDEVAKKEGWDDLLPAVVSKVMKYKGKYVAAPVNVHRVNWMWSNPEVFKKSGATLPTTWDEFFVAAEKIKKAGFTAVAHGGQPWQDLTVFESVALGVGGADWYRKAFVDVDMNTLKGDTMVKVFETFSKVKPYIDKGAPGRDWNLATAMIIKGEAGMQFMGDWAKGEFTVAKKIPGKDYNCTAAPGTVDGFTFNIDSFAMFALKDEGSKKGQAKLASTIMDPAFQEVFNLNKGSIPARLNLPMDKFDDCAKLSAKDFVSTAASKKLVPSMAHGMSLPSAVQGAMSDVVTQFFNSDKTSAKEATEKLVKAVKAAQ